MLVPPSTTFVACTVLCAVFLLGSHRIQPVTADRLIMTGSTVSSSWNIPTNYDVIEMTNVVFTGGISIVMSLGSVSSTTRPVWVTLCSCQFLSGATMYIEGDAAAVDAEKPVYINIQSPIFIDGGMAFQGYWPPGTHMTVANMYMRINNRLVLFSKYSLPDKGDGRFAYCMAFVSFYLRRQSSFLITGANIGGTWPTGSGTSANAMFPFSIYDFGLYDRSTWWIQNTTTAKAFMFHAHGSFVVQTLSTLMFINMTMICDRFCLSFDVGPLTFDDRSAFVIQDSSASVPAGESGEDLFMSRVATSFTGNSLFLVKNNQLSPYRYAFHFYGVNCVADTGSIVSFYKNSVQGTPWKMTIQLAGGALGLAQCNDLAGAQLRRIDQYQTAGLTGLTAAYSCPLGSNCPYTNVSCFMPGSTNTLTSSCDCQCNGFGVGPDCLATIRPIYKDECLVTESLRITNTKLTQTLSDRESRSFTLQHPSVTLKQTPTALITPSDTTSMTRTDTMTITINKKNAASKTAPLTFTRTNMVTADVTSTNTISSPSSKTDSGSTTVTKTTTRSMTSDSSVTPTLVRTFTTTRDVTDSESPSSSPSVTNEPSRTRSVSGTVTASSTYAASKTVSDSVSQTTASVTVTLTVPPPQTETVNPKSFTWKLTDTETFISTPTQSNTPTASRSLTPTRSPTPSETPSGTISVSDTVTMTLTTSQSSMVTASETLTTSASVSITNSTELTITKTKTRSESLSECDWFSLTIQPTPPLMMTNQENNTMEISYLSALEFGENFSLVGLGQWYITYTDYLGETTGVNATTSADLNTAMIISGKIPTFYSPEIERTVSIGVRFRCAVVDHWEFYTINILPLPSVLSAADIETLIRITSLASVLSISPAAAAAAALSMIMQQIMLCRPLYENSGVSLAGWSIGEGNPRYLRGALATNALVVLGEAALVGVFAFVIIVYSKSRPNSIRFWRVMEMLQWPNVMHISISALLQLSTVASVSLISIVQTVQDGVLALVGVTCCTSYTVWICRQVYRMHQLENSSSRKWNVAQGLGTNGFVFGDYSKPWFVGFETVIFFIVGVVAGIPPSLFICLIQMFVIFACSLLVIIMLAWHRPYKTWAGLIFAFAVHTLICLAAMSLIIGRYTRNPKAPYTAAAFLLLLIPVAALIRGGWDIFCTAKNAKVWWEKAVTAECLQDMPWDEEDDEYEDANSSEDEEMLNFGVAAPKSELLDAPLIVAADIPPLEVKKKKPKPKTSTAVDVKPTPRNEGGTAAAATYSPPSAPLNSNEDSDDVLALLGEGSTTLLPSSTAATTTTTVPPKTNEKAVASKATAPVPDSGGSGKAAASADEGIDDLMASLMVDLK